jgi:hypothetical protein
MNYAADAVPFSNKRLRSRDCYHLILILRYRPLDLRPLIFRGPRHDSHDGVLTALYRGHL